uniref:Uncharacterized protein n=1 Tax=Oryza punctata TaxID=4537 RepID=A0A0E0M4R5_ORYPU
MAARPPELIEMKKDGVSHLLSGQFTMACRTPQASLARSGRSFLSYRQHLSARIANFLLYSGGHSPAEASTTCCSISLFRAASTSLGRPRGLLPLAYKVVSKKNIIRLQITMDNAFWFVGMKEDKCCADVSSNFDPHSPWKWICLVFTLQTVL